MCCGVADGLSIFLIAVLQAATGALSLCACPEGLSASVVVECFPQLGTSCLLSYSCQRRKEFPMPPFFNFHSSDRNSPVCTRTRPSLRVQISQKSQPTCVVSHGDSLRASCKYPSQCEASLALLPLSHCHASSLIQSQLLVVLPLSEGSRLSRAHFIFQRSIGEMQRVTVDPAPIHISRNKGSLKAVLQSYASLLQSSALPTFPQTSHFESGSI